MLKLANKSDTDLMNASDLNPVGVSGIVPLNSVHVRSDTTEDDYYCWDEFGSDNSDPRKYHSTIIS